MGKETERRFLVRSEAWRKRAGDGVTLRQGYLSTDPKRKVRLRLSQDEAKIAIKGQAQGFTRPEFEYSIPLRDGEQIELICLAPVLEKVRYKLTQAELTWEIDEYLGENRGLIIAEVETTQKLGKLPPWVGPEISLDERYRNSSLVEKPFVTWGQLAPAPDIYYSLLAGENLPDAFRRILSEQIGTASRELANRPDPGESSIHEARKCLKRARSALRLVEPAIPDHFVELNQRLQAVGRELSELRDAQALIETLVELEQKALKQEAPRAGSQSEFGAVHDWLMAEKRALTSASPTKNKIRFAISSLDQIVATLPDLPLEELDFEVLTGSLKKTLKRGRKAFSQAYSHLDATHFHDFRKRAKDLRFQLALVAALWPEVLSGYSNSAKDLEQFLGDDHNLAVLAELLQEHSDHDQFAALIALLGKEQEQLRGQAKLIAERLYSDPLKVWNTRLKTSWRTWQAESK